jgi:hypothetical protein
MVWECDGLLRQYIMIWDTWTISNCVDREVEGALEKISENLAGTVESLRNWGMKTFRFQKAAGSRRVRKAVFFKSPPPYFSYFSVSNKTYYSRNLERVFKSVTRLG